MSISLFQSHVDGLSVRRVAGRKAADDSPTLVYIHGLGESGLCFERVMLDERLDSWNHCAIDLPGYGKSPWLVNGGDFWHVARFVRGWLARNVHRDIVLIGHSMGGVIGTRVAAEMDPPPVAFVNIEGNISLADCTGSLAIESYSKNGFHESGFAEFADQIFDIEHAPPALRGYYASLRMCDPSVLYRDAVELVELSKAEGLASEVGRLDVPKIYILGAAGGAGERSQDLLDQAGVSWRGIAAAGHWPFLDQHDAFVAVLGDFIETLRSKP